MNVIEFVSIGAPILLFVIGWMIKMQMNLGKLRQSDLDLMNDYLALKLEMRDFVKKEECNLMHKNTADSLSDFKTVVNDRLKSIEAGQVEMQKDIKILLQRK